MADTATQPTRYQQSEPSNECSGDESSAQLVEHLKAYARERPDVAAMWCLGIGFVLGWKLKPW